MNDQIKSAGLMASQPPRAAMATPESFKLAPSVATDEMIAAFEDAMGGVNPYVPKFQAAWGAALAAAPQAAAEPITPAYINSLPQPLRDYIHELHSNADPAGTVREAIQLRDTNAGLQAMYRKAADGLQYVTECFEAAMHEGLIDVLAATEDERLKDLVERRLMYANNKAHEVLAVTERATPPTSPAPQEESHD